MSVKFCPSIMCMKMDELKIQVRKLEEAGIDRFHLDVMDGVFVPNFALGYEDIHSICRLSNKPTELHLMISKTSDYIHYWAKAGVDIIMVHPEADYHPASTIQKIRHCGIRPGIAINPGMPVENVYELLAMVDYVLVMGVNPGFSGQKFMTSLEKKIRHLIALKKEFGYELELDGGCTFEIIQKYSYLGVDSFVLGNNSFFKENTSYEETMKQLHKISDGEMVNRLEIPKRIKLFVTDVDGTLTDGTVYIGENGEAMKGFHVKDGYALHEMLPEHGIIPVIITGRKSKIVENRAQELEIKEVHQGVSDKAALLHMLTNKFSCALSEIAYVGDDINDIKALKRCGFKACPADAVAEVKIECDYISPFHGGCGAVRDICERVIYINGRNI